MQDGDPAMDALLILAGEEQRCPRMVRKLVPIRVDIEDLLGDYFGIDSRRLEEEKLDMLRRIREHRGV